MFGVYFLKAGNISTITLAATALLAATAILGFSNLSQDNKTEAAMFVRVLDNPTLVGDTFVAEIVVNSSVPANVFAGELTFNQEVLQIESIDYNTSVADLWAERPWYSNGEGTLIFGGGTTKDGGFVGEEVLIKVLFLSKTAGNGVISIREPRILKHDGLGTDIDLYQTKDVVLSIKENNLVKDYSSGVSYSVVKEKPSTDLNGDGKQSIADISIFMMKMIGNNPRYDFNLDGKVDLKDLNVLLGAD